MNASQEIIKALAQKKKSLACAVIEIDEDRAEWGTPWFQDPIFPRKGKTILELKIGYSDEEFECFLKKLDFDYDDGFGIQVVFGILWCTDESWFERFSYDGSEHWELKERPEIPKFLIPPFEKVKKRK